MGSRRGFLHELPQLRKPDPSRMFTLVPSSVFKQGIVVKLQGAKGTLLEDGEFNIQLSFPKKYPEAPPVPAFETHIWHPNICRTTGVMCITTNWDPKMNISSYMINIQALMSGKIFFKKCLIQNLVLC